jgi:hypothetical protein
MTYEAALLKERRRKMSLRTFELHRVEDVSGMSGTGVIADGVVFPDGRCAYRWRGGVAAVATTVTADSIGDVERIHGHEGRTRIVWTGAEHA